MSGHTAVLLAVTGYAAAGGAWTVLRKGSVHVLTLSFTGLCALGAACGWFHVLTGLVP